MSIATGDMTKAAGDRLRAVLDGLAGLSFDALGTSDLLGVFSA
jgi:hypothetical protein